MSVMFVMFWGWFEMWDVNCFVQIRLFNLFQVESSEKQKKPRKKNNHKKS